MSNVNWNSLLEELKTAGKEALSGLVEAVAEDASTDGLAQELAEITVEALRAGDQKVLDEAKANLPWLLEKYRLRAANVTNETIAKVIGTLQKGVSLGLSAVLGAL